jgi:predicted ester cyclase
MRTIEHPRALALSVLTGVFLAATLAFGAHPALAAYTARVQAGTLRITGNAASDKLALRLDPGSPTTLQLDVGEDGTADFSFDRSTFTAIDVEAGAGDDEVRIDESGGSFTDETVTMNGGAGDDTLLGGSGADNLLGGGGSDFVDANRGSDQASLGAGNDRFQWDPGDGSDVVEGQGGSDRLDFNGANIGEQMEVSANGPRVRFTRNIAAIVMDLDGIETVALETLGGADTVAVDDLTGTDVDSVDVDLDASGGIGDGQADRVTATGTGDADKVNLTNADGRLVVGGLAAQTRVSGGEAALDNIEVDTLGGADTLTTTAAVIGATPVTFDGGEGSDEAHFNGTGGDDQIATLPNGTTAATFAPGSALLNTAATVESLVVAGLDGNDTITASNGLATLIALTIDGGDGGDTLLGGDGADVLLAGKGDDVVDGNRGNDQASLGAGNDRFQWDPGDGSDVVEGQGGSDRLDFNGANIGEQMEVSANGSRVRFTRNVGAIVMDLDGIETLALETLGGADTVAVDDLAGTDVKTVDVDLDAIGGIGDGQPDTVIARGTGEADRVTLTNADGRLVVGGLAAQARVSGGEAALDNVTVATLDGADSITTTSAVTAATPIVLDGGDGDDTAHFNGTGGDDQISIVANGATAAAFAPGSALLNSMPTVESLIVAGLDGNDTITAGNGLATLTALTLDGGDGDDTLLGGDGADVLLAGKGDDVVDGNRGNDQASLGAGNDRFQWDPGDGSDAVEGQGGSDRLDFNGANIGEHIELSANGPRVRLTRDIAAISMDLDGIEQVAVRALGGADAILVDDLSGTAVDTVDVDLAAVGGSGDGEADTVTTNGTSRRDVVQVTRSGSEVSVAGLAALTRIVGSEATLDTLLVQTLDGNDTVTVAPDVADVITPVVDLDGGE